jgi:tetratricopeptide (TPR) repeat protein
MHARAAYARCLAAREQYQQAKELVYELIRISTEDPALIGQLVEQLKTWNEKLITQREKTFAEDPANIKNIIELAWCYAQNDRIDDAMALAATIDPDYEDAYAYHNLMGKLYHNTEKFAQALSHMQQVETVLRAMTDDGTEETRKRLKRLPEMLQVQGDCLLKLDRADEAMEKFRQALELAPEDTEVLLIMGRALFSAEDYAGCAQTLRRLLQLSPGTWVAELLLSLCLYYRRQDREAFDAINRALSIQEYDLGLYVVKMQILLRNEAFAEVHEILDFLQETGAPGDIALDFIRAELTELEKQDKKIGILLVGECELDDPQYTIIPKQFDCICDYLGWEIAFTGMYSALDPGDILKVDGAIEELESFWQKLV